MTPNSYNPDTDQISIRAKIKITKYDSAFPDVWKESVLAAANMLQSKEPDLTVATVKYVSFTALRFLRDSFEVVPFGQHASMSEIAKLQTLLKQEPGARTASAPKTTPSGSGIIDLTDDLEALPTEELIAASLADPANVSLGVVAGLLTSLREIVATQSRQQLAIHAELVANANHIAVERDTQFSRWHPPQARGLGGG